jgi:hypothetical protein
MKIILAALLVLVTFSAHADYFQDSAGKLYYLDHADVSAWKAKLPADAVAITDAQAASVQAAQAAAAAAAQAALPNPTKFAQDVKTAMGGIVAGNALMKLYPAFFPAISTATYPDVQALILDAQITGALTAAEYSAIKSAAIADNIPITLP